jgi:hypothetical protein
MSLEHRQSHPQEWQKSKKVRQEFAVSSHVLQKTLLEHQSSQNLEQQAQALKV